MYFGGRVQYAQLSDRKEAWSKTYDRRVRNPIYYRQIGLLKEDLHLSMAVNPELIVADEISRLLIFPGCKSDRDIC